MDIATLQSVIDHVKFKVDTAQERFNLHPTDPFIDGNCCGKYELLMDLEKMLRDELEERDEHAIDC